MQIIQIVRNFSERGGMERYVWELTNILSRKGYNIIVICETSTSIGRSIPNLRVFEVGRSLMPSGWLRLLDFSRRARQLLVSFDLEESIIHSHERTGIHQITTFHGPPFAKIHEYPWFRKLSPRVWAYLWMEYRELCGAQVIKIVPNSATIKREITKHYSCATTRLVTPITPGVGWVEERKFRKPPSDSGVIGFVGKEWKRKGLEFFFKIVRNLLVIRPNLQILIVGPEENAIKHLLLDYPGKYECIGWQAADKIYRQMDLLLHPAKSEPYGMVVAEAMAARLPVVVSTVSGVSADVSSENGTILNLVEPIQHWVEACNKWLAIESPPPKYSRSWENVADEYIKLYESTSLALRADARSRL